MILRNTLDEDIELHSFGMHVDDSTTKEEYFKWLENLQVTKLISSEDLILPKTTEFIDNSFERFTQKNSIGFFIKHLSTDKIIGTAKLDQISFYKRTAWDGIMIGDPQYHGQGLGYKVYKILLGYGFQVLGLNKINGGCNQNNVAMIKLFEKIGYTREGVLRKCDYIDGSYSDHFLYGILREEFLHSNRVDLGL